MDKSTLNEATHSKRAAQVRISQKLVRLYKGKKKSAIFISGIILSYWGHKKKHRELN